MVWFQCEDCGENLKTPELKKHFSICSATKNLSRIECGNIFGKNSVELHNQCLTEAEKYGPKRPSIPKENSKREIDFNRNVAVSNGPSWFCSLCNSKTACEKNFVAHVRGKKHREKAKEFEQPILCKDNSNQLAGFDITLWLSNQSPWFCSLCNTKATSQQDLLAHADGKKHRAKAKGLHAKQQQSKRSSMDKKDTIENAFNGDGDSKQKKLDLQVSSGVANGCYSQPDKKRKLETFNGNIEVVQSEEANEGGEKKAKKEDHEKKGKKKQTESDSDFEYDKEDMKLQLVSYSKEELIYLIYKTVEKGSRLMSTILESTEHDISQRNIVVRGFGWDTTHEYLKAAFESYGEIEDCSVVMDKDTGRSKGYGFVLFKTRKGAREALKNPEKRMYNRTVVCNLASANPCEPAFPGIEQTHGHVLKKRHQQPTMDMFGHNMPFYGHSQRAGFDPMYGPLRGNQMVTGLSNYRMFGSGLMNQGFVAPSNHVGMAGQYFGDPERTYWYQR